MNRLRNLLVAVVVLCFVGAVGVWAAEVPQEHPMPEHPTKGVKATQSVSTAALEKAIRQQITEKANGGQFPVRDDVLAKTWQLELVKVHTDKLTQLDDKTYFACVDMKAAEDTIVDVDFFLKDDGGKLALSDTTVHKISGKPRYSWAKKGNFWERVPIAR